MGQVGGALGGGGSACMRGNVGMKAWLESSYSVNSSMWTDHTFVNDDQCLVFSFPWVFRKTKISTGTQPKTSQTKLSILPACSNLSTSCNKLVNFIKLQIVC